jgi:hypothetical protein
VVLTNRLTTTLSGDVPPALIAAGLPASSIADYMTAVAGGLTDFSAIPGVTPEIQAAGALAYREAYLAAYHTIFYVSIGFGCLGILCNIMVPNIDKYMTNSVATRLHEGKQMDAAVDEKIMTHAH